MTDRTGRRAPRPNYGSKRRVRRDGYVDVYDPTHPIARRDGYLMEHRRMAWDAELFDNPALQVHHLNEVRDDNRLENFVILEAAEHAQRHAAERGTISNQYGTFPLRPPDHIRKLPRPERVCPVCGEIFGASRRRDAIYCSDNCRNRRHNKRH